MNSFQRTCRVILELLGIAISILLLTTIVTLGVGWLQRTLPGNYFNTEISLQDDEVIRQSLPISIPQGAIIDLAFLHRGRDADIIIVRMQMSEDDALALRTLIQQRNPQGAHSISEDERLMWQRQLPGTGPTERTDWKLEYGFEYLADSRIFFCIPQGDVVTVFIEVSPKGRGFDAMLNVF